ncbi:MAG TPA: MASE3 domain-containing protein [Bacillota bacterium]|nr:MASE3 domain-containing protein [Bacillota bacterium]
MDTRRTRRDILTIVAVFVSSIIILTAAERLEGYIYTVFNTQEFLSWHLMLELISIIMSICIFLVGYFAHERSYHLKEIILASVFLSVGLLDTFHTLSYKGMPTFFTQSSANRATTFWIAARLTMAIGMLIAGTVDHKKKVRVSKNIFLILPLLWSFTVFYLVTYHPDWLPSMFIDGQGLTPLKIILEYTIMLILAIGMILFGRTDFRTQRSKAYLYIVIALLISIFSESAFTMYTSVYDTYNMLGHMFKIVSHILLFNALFVLNVQRPYTELRKAERELSRYAGNLEKLVEDRTEQIAAANEKLLQDLDYAKNIQNALLPASFPNTKSLEFAAKYFPCERVGGDFYNVYKLDDENFGILIGDVAGHGVSAAMITVFIHQNIHVRRVYEDGSIRVLTPKQVLTNLYHTYNKMSFPDEAYTVLFYGIFNTQDKTLTYSSAGHNMPPLILKSNGDVSIIDLKGLPICKLGRLVDVSYENSLISMDSGDSLILYTDGLTEIDRTAPERFDEQNLAEFIRGIKDASAEEIADSILDAYYAILGDEKTLDDVTLLIAKAL